VSIGLFSSPNLSVKSRSVFGGAVSALVYRAKVEIDGKRMKVMMQPVPGGQERIIGRDVLNQLRVLFNGPKRALILVP
jgi:predicted aspartyl protease